MVPDKTSFRLFLVIFGHFKAISDKDHVVTFFHFLRIFDLFNPILTTSHPRDFQYHEIQEITGSKAENTQRFRALYISDDLSRIYGGDSIFNYIYTFDFNTTTQLKLSYDKYIKRILKYKI